MAGLFYLLRGSEEGFAEPVALKGSDDKPLIVPSGDGDEGMLLSICTRPTAVDYDGDGDLDIVTGNFGGSFWLFEGQGKGVFAPAPTKIAALKGMHSDPFFVDWDRDGDLDLVSGSADGGVFLFDNTGTRQKPMYGKTTTLVEPMDRSGPMETKMGEAHIQGPQSSTRIWVDDLNGDNKWDILIGDSVDLEFPAKGLDEATALARLKEWNIELETVYKKLDNAESEEAADKEIEAIWAKRDTIVNSKPTGYIWVLMGK